MSDRINTSDPIENKLYEAWKQERKFYHIRGFSRCLIWALGLLLVDLLIDWGIIFQARLSGRMAIILLLVNVLILAWVFWREWWRHLKPYDAVNVALEVEDKHPDLLSRLVSYVQLKGDVVADQKNISVDLIKAMKEEALDLSKPIDFREVVDFKQLKNLVITACALVFFFGAVSVNWTDHMKTLLLRMVGTNENYPTQTQIVKLAENQTIQQGGSVTLWAEASGEIPEDAKIYVRTEQEPDYYKLIMEKSEDGVTFKREFPDIYEDMEYYVRVGDAQSKPFKVSIVPAPKIKTSLITLSYPEYMNKQETRDDSKEMNLEVPEGTQINWDLSCDRPISKLEVIINDTETIEAEVSTDGLKASFRYTAAANFKYTFKWTEKANGFEYKDVVNTVRVAPDRLPEVELLQPSSDGLATVNKTLKIFADASDDFGLGKVYLVYLVDGQKEEKLLIQDYQGKVSTEVSYSWNVKESIPELKEGVTISYYLEVRDRYPNSDTHFRHSATLKMNIVSQARYLEWIREELAAQQEEIVKARDSEVESSSKVKTLIKLEGKQ